MSEQRSDSVPHQEDEGGDGEEAEGPLTEQVCLLTSAVRDVLAAVADLRARVGQLADGGAAPTTASQRGPGLDSIVEEDLEPGIPQVTASAEWPEVGPALDADAGIRMEVDAWGPAPGLADPGHFPG